MLRGNSIELLGKIADNYCARSKQKAFSKEYTDMDGYSLYLFYFVGFLFWSQQLPLVRCESQRKLVMLNAVSRHSFWYFEMLQHNETRRKLSAKRNLLIIAVDVPLFGFSTISWCRMCNFFSEFLILKINLAVLSQFCWNVQPA